MVDMVNYQMIRGVHDFTMHLNGFSFATPACIKCFAAAVSYPLKLGQLVVIDSVNDSEFSAGKGYPTNGSLTELAICTGVEIFAGTVEMENSCPWGKTLLLIADKYSPARAGYVGRKEAVVATSAIFNFRFPIFYLYPIRGSK